MRYQAEAHPFHETICHCADCRRSVGAAEVAWFSVKRAAFRFVAGEPASYRSSPGVTRRFCGTCGTSLTFELDDTPDEVDVTIASLDDPGAVPPKDHSWTASKPGWAVLGDGLPQFPGPAER
ncbi:GFA family protein [uncultured Enterovirga sp.]|uniref:GFA family protein n=1 Tax=uncultured Enterovirga sp. TaxID=2026352 RepID=UPI0035CC9580